MTKSTDRVRTPPADRLVPPIGVFHVVEAAARLWNESGATKHGHRQQVLARHGLTTVALFVFEAGASLAPHEAPATVVIQCVDGELTVTADGRNERLTPGTVLVLAPGVKHGVHAARRSTLLLTVALETDHAHP